MECRYCVDRYLWLVVNIPPRSYNLVVRAVMKLRYRWYSRDASFGVLVTFFLEPWPLRVRYKAATD
jgi:hypothetical protein